MVSSLTRNTLTELGIGKNDAKRRKNMFALGLLSRISHLPVGGTAQFLRGKFANEPDIRMPTSAPFSSAQRR
ncbi:hypothetical protein K7711_43735 [Nocardia sp. CA2R105]|uniref:hypothetical protein n=1 Tax=Nocardia coffeae TaxID=2873381 RepID=UPI001CA73D13|nr:hypothetical protein [Nocardia coffeae]MBY8863444.1 hypothetical protein [Nocardia coffeae]